MYVQVLGRATESDHRAPSGGNRPCGDGVEEAAYEAKPFACAGGYPPPYYSQQGDRQADIERDDTLYLQVDVFRREGG